MAYYIKESNKKNDILIIRQGFLIAVTASNDTANLDCILFEGWVTR